MSEEQLRDVLSRVVPEAPDSVADPAPVVRAARARRRAQVVGIAGVVALVAVTGVVGGRALLDDDSGPQVAEEVSLPGDPYSAASCPEVLPESGPLPDLSDVTAVRFCAAGFNGFPAQPGPPDALLDGIDGFAKEVAALPDADPARCAAVDVIPSDSRLAFELADGTLAFVPATMCTDVTIDGRKVDGADLTAAFMGALDGQRDGHTYVAGDNAEMDCEETQTLAPAQPGRDDVVAATWCRGGVVLTEGAVELVADGWSQAVVAEPCLSDASAAQSFVLARTDRGDVVKLAPCGPDLLGYDSWKPDISYRAPISFESLRLNAS